MTQSKLRSASTVVLARDAHHRMEVFLVRGDDRVAFMGGAHVFPGGRVDAAHLLDEPEMGCDAIAHATARLGDMPAATAIAYHVAAARELFEEAGVLLAREGGRIVSMADGDEGRFSAYRMALARREITIRDLLARERLRLALDALMLFAHWVTPAIETTRFDTRFFFARLPDGQEPVHDAHETTHGEWMTPQDAVERCRRGEIALPPPTWTTLRRLSMFASTAEAWAWAGSCAVPRVQPGFSELGDGTRMVLLPGDPLFPPVEGFEAAETRFILKDGRWTVLTDA
jgi:8-oxo-dGTP pyrophosphatase MutT (NUDIX family)